jgi:hypothetical protein
MKILIEQFDYELAALQNLLPADYYNHKKNNKVSIDFVGYYNNFATNETVIILPKIFLDYSNETVFATIPVRSFVTENALQLLQDYQKSKSDIHFIYRFAFIFYLSLREFQARNLETEITEKTATKNIISNIENTAISELDLVFSLLRFYQENRELIIFTQKENEKQHFKKTNWAKTIRRQNPILQDNTPIYTETNQRNRQNNSEDELLAIFFTVLYRFKTQYGFSISLENTVVEPAKADFDRKALRSLKNIRHNYFTDKFKKLLLLLLSYFEKRSSGNAKESKEEFILCSNYNIVFEDMIDKLLSDKGSHIDKMKNQEDGKIVDHIFEYTSFFNPDSIFYIGDAKYYKETTKFSSNSIYKQHTYAKNIIQYNLNLFNDLSKKGENLQNIRYRDELTEGYNITPNFFIQGYIDHQNMADFADNFRFDDTQNPKVNFHFENRIFDRDTLLIYHFTINFVFVLQSYVEKNETELASFSQKAKETIKAQVWQHLNKNYEFLVLTPTTNVESFVTEHFKVLNGKIYRNSQQENSLILGLERKFTEENEAIKNKFSAILH